MRKSVVFFCLLFAIGCGLGAAQAASKGTKTIKIVPDPAFGRDFPWDTVFNTSLDNSLAFLPDGGFFRGCEREGKIYQFDPLGKLRKSFGRKGQGPGDLLGVMDLDILDGAKLVVYGGRRLSLFDLNGGFQKALSVSGTILDMVALRNGKIAFVRDIPARSDPKWFKGRYSVFITDVETAEEREIASFDYAVPRGEFLIRITQFDRHPRLAKTGSDTFLMASPASPEVLLYSLDGEKRGSFPLNLEPVEFTWDVLAFVMDFDHDPKGREIMTLNKGKIALPEHLPYHLGIAGDTEGRINVFENGFARKTRDVSFRLYAPDGKLLSTNKIDPGEFEPARPPRFRNGYAYGWLTKKDGDGTFVFGRWKTGL